MAMNPISRDRLYKLLPAIYRLRDVAEGEPLKALLAVIEQEVETIEQDIGNLYDNWFIETCDEWVIPYIGDLLDVRALYASAFPANQLQNQSTTIETASDRPPHPRPYGQQERRAYIANTLAYRRRKGTTPVLEQLVRDVTGWQARAIEASTLLLTTQSLNHLRPTSTTVDLRDSPSLNSIGTPFEQRTAYTVEVRRASQGGKYNIPNVGLFIWRLRTYPVDRSTARIMHFDDEPAGRFYTFNPLGYDDVPLYNQPQSTTEITKQAQEINLPAPLRCAPLARELRERRQLRLQGKPLPSPRYFNDSSPVLQIFVNGQSTPIPPEEILICRLALTPEELAEAPTENSAEEQTPIEGYQPWQFPDANLEQSAEDISIPTQVVAVDPERGRIAFLDRTLPERVEVSYLYGFSDDLGGGSYPRGAVKTALLKSLLKNPAQNQLEATQVEDTPKASQINLLFWEVGSLQSAAENPLNAAIQDWNRTVLAWQALQAQIHIPLAQITMPPVQPSRISSRDVPPRFKPGIVEQGLEVVSGCYPTEVLIQPGLAIDRQGRGLHVQHIETVNLSEIDWVSPEQTDQVILVICYRAALEGQRYQFALVPETAIGDDGYAKGTLIPLARLQLDSERRLLGQPDLNVRRDTQFQPGVVQGFEVQICPDRLEVIVTPGTAVDTEGKVLVSSQTMSVNLIPEQGIVGSLVAARRSRSGQRCEVKFIPGIVEPEAAIVLAHLHVPLIDSTSIKVKPFPLTGQEHQTGSGIVDGLAVTLEGIILTVGAGTAKDSQGQEIKLEHAYQFDLSSCKAGQFVLFISRQKKQGLPLQPAHSPKDQDWQQLGLVPQEPESANTGIILIQDSLKYEGDLEIAIPQGKKLKIIAADRCRPHIAGDVRVRGTAPADEPDQGVLVLDGLLIEGQLQVLPGQLKHLHLIHSTLVPEQGGLWVQPQEESAPCCTFDVEDPFAPVAFVVTMLAFIQELWETDLRLDRSPEKHLGQFTQLVMQQINRLLTEVWQILCPWTGQTNGSFNSQSGDWYCLSGSSAAEEMAPQDNSRLEISLYHSICGSLTLTETIPKLRIEDSILDKGQSKNNDETSGFAIWAANTDTEISATTVLGMTKVRSLEASNSLFTEKVTVQLHQIGCIRFCHVPAGSQTPPRYQCQPDRTFQEVLDPIPEAITSIAMHTRAGTGTITSDSENSYQVIGHQTAFSRNLKPNQVITAEGQTRTVREIVDDTHLILDRSFEPKLTEQTSYQTSYLFSSSAGGGIFRSINNGEKWEKANGGLLNPYVATVLAYEQPGIGEVQAAGKTVVGGEAAPATAFTEQFRPGDTITIQGEIRIVAEILNKSRLTVDMEFGHAANSPSTFAIHTVLAGTTGGQIYRSKNDGKTWVALTLAGVSSTITALCQYRWAFTGTLLESRLEVEVDPSFSKDRFQIGDTVTSNNGQPDQQTRRIDAIEQSAQKTTLILNAPFNASLTNSPVNFYLNALLAATAGDGVLKGNANGENWIQINQGLTNSDVRALIVSETGEVFAGTAGGGVFQLIYRESQDNSGDRWISMSDDLKNRNITALAIDRDGIIFAGTDGGVFRCETDQAGRMSVSQSLTSLEISALAIAGDARVAATNDGKTFYSIDGGQRWEQLSLDLKGLNISALAVGVNQHTLFAGTDAGNILRAEGVDSGWLSVNAGLPNVLEKLLIMERLQPNFTSTCYGNPGYVQLSRNCAQEIRTGAEDGAEMGTFNGLKQPQREANLQSNLEEFLRFGLEAGIFYIT